jgi:DNA-binding MarR family transcriptional regulator
VSDTHELAEALRDFLLRSHRLMDRRMRAEGVSLARFKLLSFILREQPVRSTDVATAFGYSPRTVTEALDGLEREGLIARQPDPVDRRAKRISITPVGETALRASEPLRDRLRDDVFGTLSGEERAAMAAALAKLNHRLAALEAPE